MLIVIKQLDHKSASYNQNTYYCTFLPGPIHLFIYQSIHSLIWVIAVFQILCFRFYVLYRVSVITLSFPTDLLFSHFTLKLPWAKSFSYSCKQKQKHLILSIGQSFVDLSKYKLFKDRNISLITSKNKCSCIWLIYPENSLIKLIQM